MKRLLSKQRVSRQWLVCCAVAVSLSSFGPAARWVIANQASPFLPLLRRVDQIRQLTPEEARAARPVRIRGVITYHGGPGWEFFVQDATGGIYVDYPSLEFTGRAGQLVQIEGVTSPGDFAPMVTQARIRILGQAPLPTPARASLTSMITGKQDSQWVEVHGIVRAADNESGQASLDVVGLDGRFKVRLPNFSEEVTRLVGAVVIARGACGSFFNKRRQVLGVQVYVPGLEYITIRERSTGPEDLPVVQVDSLQRFNPKSSKSTRARVHGVVTAAREGEWLYIRDLSEALLVKTSQKSELAPGDRVEVFGFPSGGDYKPSLEDSSFKKIGVEPSPLPLAISAEEALQGTYDAELIQLEARFLGTLNAFGDRVLVLQSNNLVFNAQYREVAGERAAASIEAGSLLRITGVCSVSVDSNHQPRSFRIWLREPEDIVVIERPGWWRLRHTLITLSVVLLIAGGAFAWIAVLRREVAARTRSLEQSLTQVEHLKNRYQDLFESANDIIYTTDLTGGLSSINRMGEIVTGYSREELLGMSVGFQVNRENVRAMLETHDRRLADQSHTTHEMEILSKAGSRVPLEVSSRLILEDGEPTGIVGIARDITDRKKAAEALQRAKDAADAANVAKSQFLANMSHEIRTPLNGIIGMTELTLETDLTPEQAESIGIVRESAELLLEIVNDVLDFSKIEAGMLTLDPHEFNLRECLGRAVDPFALKSASKGLELVLDIHPDVPDLLYGDASRLRQVALNLLNNAVKFTDRGEVVLSVSREFEQGEMVGLRFSVRDTGIGIPPEKLDLIFKAFTQADGSTTRKYGGTGLGLTISRTLVEMMGGRIWVNSRSGVGSVFHFSLPLRREEQGESEQPLRSAPSLVGLRVVVVEPQATSREVLHRILAHWGMEVTAVQAWEPDAAEVASGGRSGNRYDFAVIDERSLASDNTASHRRLRTNSLPVAPRIVWLRSRGCFDDDLFGPESGKHVSVTKPVKDTDLLKALLALCEGFIPQGLSDCEKPECSQVAPSRSLRILLAEDNETNQKVVLRMLEKRGHSVVLARNGREALECWAREGFDLILMDIQMPEIGGLEATAAIRKSEKTKGGRVPIVALTAHALQEDRQPCLDAGMDRYITKPIRPDELLAAIIDLTSRDQLKNQGSLQTEEVQFLDRRAILARFENDTEFILDIVSLFIGESTRVQGEIKVALARGDHGSLERSAHSLKGSLNYFGALAASATAQELEMMGRRGNLKGAEEVVLRLDGELEKLRTELAEFRRESVRRNP